MKSLAKTPSTPRNQRSNLFAIRVMPSLIRDTLKLIKRPKRLSAKRRYVKSCFLCTGRSSETDLISTMTFSATTKSARKPISKRVPSNTTGIICCVSTSRPRFLNSLAKTVSYTLSNSPAPRPRCTCNAASTICFAMSSSVIHDQVCERHRSSQSWRSWRLGEQLKVNL